MPLIHSKKPAAFKHNIATEVLAGKPVKQATAIAYSEKEQAEHKAHGGAIEDCSMCKRSKMAKGGRVSDREIKQQREALADSVGNSVGTTEQFHETGKNTPIGMMQREDRVRELSQSERPLKGLAEGGAVHEDAEQDQEMMDQEIHDLMGEELISAIDSKDKKRIMESIEALVLSCLNKEK